MILPGSSVRIPETNETGTVISIDNGFAKIQTSNAANWHKIIDIVDINDKLLQKYLHRDFDTRNNFVLAIDSHRLEVAHMWNPVVYASATRIDLYPHQLNAVASALDMQRIMIADEVGLGKTITALLAVYELFIARKVIDRVLFVVPSPLRIKWQNELKYRFNINADIINNDYLKINPKAFESKKYIYISSIDFLKKHIDIVPHKHIDCVIIDEAHKAKKETDRYKIAKKLSQASRRLILLTATPHDGKDENFLSLMQLLSPDIDTPRMAQFYMIRNTKENVVDISGKTVFPPRISKTVEIKLEGSERNIYLKLENYLQKCIRSAHKPQEINAMRFVSIIFRKRASSSLYSLCVSLKRRYDRLGEITADTANKHANNIKDADIDLDDLEVDNPDNQNDILDIELYTAQKNLKEERADIQDLIKLIDDLQTHDSKVDRLLDMIKQLRKNDHHAQMIIFTEYRSTMDYLYERLSSYAVGKIHGGMPMAARESVRESFANKQFDLLLCTDAAGEGIDLQFCNIEVNYDLPWNPNRLEQRMGRIHRIGQKRNVEYYNFVVFGDKIGADGYIHRLLLEKLNTIKKTLGDVVYDLFGSTYPPEQFVNLTAKLPGLPYQEWKEQARPITEGLEKKIKSAYSNMSKLLGTKILNRFTLKNIVNLQYDMVDATDIKRHIETLILTHAGSIEEIADNHYKITLPPDLAYSLNVGIMTGTYNKELAYRHSNLQYLALGDKVVDKLINHSILTRPVSILGHSTKDGGLFAYRVKVFDGHRELRNEKLVLLHCSTSGEIRPIDEKSVWDYSSKTAPSDLPPIDSYLTVSTNKISKLAVDLKNELDQTLNEYIKQYTQFARSEASAQISQIDNHIKHAETTQKVDPTHVEIIRDLEQQKEKISEKWQRRKHEIALLANTSCSWELLGIALIVPDEHMRKNVRIEQAGIKAVLQHEHDRATKPEQQNMIHDVSDKSCGYDIESFENRHIEVKSFSATGNPSMTPHEWDVARRYGDDYWLYIVENSVSSPQIHVRQNPYELYKDSIRYQQANNERWIITNWKT